MRFDHKLVDLENLIDETTNNGRTYLTPDGNKYPSITTVLKHLSSDFIDQWRKNVGEDEANKVSHHASVRGSHIHDLMERYISGENIDSKKIMSLYRPSYLKLTKILDENLSEVYAKEVALYSNYLKVAGRTDLIGKFGGKKSIIDFKTSKRIKKKEDISSYFLQTTAYAIMFEERTKIPITNLVIIMDIDNNDPIIFTDHRDNWSKQLLLEIKEYYRLNALENT